jgi:hypothetical protein
LRCSIPGREEEMGKRLGGHSKQEKMENWTVIECFWGQIKWQRWKRGLEERTI